MKSSLFIQTLIGTAAFLFVLLGIDFLAIGIKVLFSQHADLVLRLIGVGVSIAGLGMMVFCFSLLVQIAAKEAPT